MATMNISLSDDLREFVEGEVRSGDFSSSSEYMRQLLREKREERRLRQMLLAGVDSSLSTLSHDEFVGKLRSVARDG